MREDIESLLDDKYEIIGYSDSDPIYEQIKEYEYKSFYSPEELVDYIYGLYHYYNFG